MDEVERAQTRLLSLQREKVKSNILCLEMIQLASQFILVLYLCSCFLFIFFWGGNSLFNISSMLLSIHVFIVT